MELLDFINEKPVVPKLCYRVTYRCKLKSETNWRIYVDYSKFQTEEETIKAFWVVKRKDTSDLDFEIIKLEKIPYKQAKSKWMENLKAWRRVLGERKTKWKAK